jgi:hypothetical protein
MPFAPKWEQQERERDRVIIQFNSVQFSSVLYYLLAESTAARPITDTAQCRYR